MQGPAGRCGPRPGMFGHVDNVLVNTSGKLATNSGGSAQGGHSQKLLSPTGGHSPHNRCCLIKVGVRGVCGRTWTGVYGVGGRVRTMWSVSIISGP